MFYLDDDPQAKWAAQHSDRATLPECEAHVTLKCGPHDHPRASRPVSKRHNQMTAERESCGLGSIIPMSCRTRAEAFARRLESRLNSLGRSGTGLDDSSDENSWIAHKPSVTSCQPKLSSSSDSDIFFDFDFEPPGSPEEEVVVTEVVGMLVNKPQKDLKNDEDSCNCPSLPQDTDSGSVVSFSTTEGTSPTSDDSSDAVYYDPEGSDTECSRSSRFSEDTDVCLPSDRKQRHKRPWSQRNGESSTDKAHANLYNGYLKQEGACHIEQKFHPEERSLQHKAHDIHNKPVDQFTPKNKSDPVSGSINVLKETSSSALPNGEIANECFHSDRREATKLEIHENHNNDESSCNSNLIQKSLMNIRCYPFKDGSANTIKTDTNHHTTETAHGEQDSDEDSLALYIEESLTKSIQSTILERPHAKISMPNVSTHESALEFSSNDTHPHTTETTQEAKGSEEEDLASNIEECLAKSVQKTVIDIPDVHNIFPNISSYEPSLKSSATSKNAGDFNEYLPSTYTCTKVANEESSIENESTRILTDTSEESYCSSFTRPTNLLIDCGALSQTIEPLSQVVPVPPPSKNEVISHIKTIISSPTETSEKECEISISTTEDDDYIDDDERPQRLRRCSSLKSGKTPPGTPGNKKIVRFADVLGLDLADVRTFLDEIPKVPKSAYQDLEDVDLSLGSDQSPNVVSKYVSKVTPLSSAVKPEKCLVPLFQQPGGQTDFLDRVRDRKVCLENAVVVDSTTFSISGTIRVRNLDFHKSVHVRYSLDGWKTFSDLQATYVPNSCDGFSDKFTFQMYAHTLGLGGRLEFALRFQCRGIQYWDNNLGANYVFQCLPPVSSSIPSLPMISPMEETWSTSFY
ncbi:unnamed protein product [Timema podura]|uniref:CBM21 domain-containing protein n=1 Tax=Timema podura TaxID=61482 RepID=A0ABN7P2K2_TIMPD|nr:unnamed protein product [Timema podura]